MYKRKKKQLYSGGNLRGKFQTGRDFLRRHGNFSAFYIFFFSSRAPTTTIKTAGNVVLTARVDVNNIVIILLPPVACIELRSTNANARSNTKIVVKNTVKK